MSTPHTISILPGQADKAISSTAPSEVRTQQWPEVVSPLVSICCITYAHGDYIRDAIEGFLMQRTTFRVEILIHDDASPDNTVEIIKEYETAYPGLIRTLYQRENKFSKGFDPAAEFLFPIARGDYIALCEGDDFWTDPYKLQKQVTLLESHPEVSTCVGGYSILSGKRELNKDVVINKKSSGLANGFEFSLGEMEQTWLTKTLTAVFRKNILQDIDLSQYQYSRDIHLFYHLIKDHKAFYFKEIFGVYRIHKGGIFSMHKEFEKKLVAYQCYRELFLCHRDSFTRNMYLRCTLGLLNYNLYNRHSENSVRMNIRLLTEAVSLVQSFTHLKMLALVWFSREVKDKVRRLIGVHDLQ